MTWAGQSVFALPCGDSGGASIETHGIILDAAATTTSDGLFQQVGNLVLSLPVAASRAAVISLTGTATNQAAGHRTEFKVSVDGAELDEVCEILVTTGEDPQTVAVTGQTLLAPGTRLIRAVWRTQTGGTGAAAMHHLHLQVILGQAVP